MKTRLLSVTLVATLLPSLAVAQQATTVAAAAPATASMPAPAKSDSAPVASAFRDNFKQISRNLIDAGDENV